MVDMWMVRAGENAFLFDDFKQNNIIAIGWEIGDLSGKNPDEIKQMMMRKYPDASITSLGLNSAQVSKFVCDFKIDDYVITYNHRTRKYLIGRITSDYYFSLLLAEKYGENDTFYHHVRDIEWLGETSRDDLKETTLKPLKSVMTIFNINNSAKNDILAKINQNKYEWTDFYMEFADKLLEYKNNHVELVNKIQNVFKSLDMNLATLERDNEGREILPTEIDPFTIFALFNKQISTENRINIVRQIKEEFSLKTNYPMSFHGISVVNNLKATFYWFADGRGENDISNLWQLFESALELSKQDNPKNRERFISIYNQVLTQNGIRWNITMALNWIRPFNFINLDTNNRDILSSDDIFSNEFKEEIKSLKMPPKGDKYLKIIDIIKSVLTNSNKYNNFPELSLNAYLLTHHNGGDGADGGIGDIRTPHYWLISAGSSGKWWDDFYKNNEVGIGFTGTGDLNQYYSKEEIKEKFQEIYDDNATHRNNVHACWQFLKEMEIGDIIFVKKGQKEILGRGIVESDYLYDESKPYHKIRKVKWTHKGKWISKDSLPTKTLTDITIYQEFVDGIKGLFVSEGENEDDIEEFTYPPYSLDMFLEEVYIGENDYNILVNILNNKKNLIIQGAPGVGKTFMAKRLAYSMMGIKDSQRVRMVQFHQSYSYEDFIMGYRPTKDGFELKDGSFYDFCKIAEEDSENDYFFIIDEINRGNLSKIFGELFMLIEADKRGEKNKVRLLYSNEYFFIPKNLYIIGLMNTADRSLAMIDYALRRRFAFFSLKPGFSSDGFNIYQSELENSKFDNIITVMNELNEEIKEDESLGEGFQIGHSYLCNLTSEEVEEKLTYIIEYELIPLLNEYWFDEPDKVKLWSDRLRSVLNDS